MTNATSDVRVSVAPGSGRIARRPGALLFDPTGDNVDLMAEFDQAATDEAAITVVKQHLIDVGFDASPVVVIDWRSEGLALLVFGDADVRTSAAAAPNISGVGSGTWIERHLGVLELGDADEVQVWCGDETDDATDLRLGVIRSGGVRITMGRLPAVEAQAAVEPAVVEPAPVEQAAVEQEQLPAVPEREPESANPRPVPSPDPAAAAVAAVAPSAAESAAANAPVKAGFVADANDLEWTDSAAPGGAGLVEATLCSDGHGNPPHHTVCRTCAVEIDPGTEVSLIPQPSVGHLRFSSGDAVEVASDLIVGRKPVPESPNVRPVVVDHAEVSRSHIDVRIDGWSVLVTDRGSRNGTWVIPPNDPTPIKLDPEVPYVLEHGTAVHLGGPDASFTYDASVQSPD